MEVERVAATQSETPSCPRALRSLWYVNLVRSSNDGGDTNVQGLPHPSNVVKVIGHLAKTKPAGRRRSEIDRRLRLCPCHFTRRRLRCLNRRLEEPRDGSGCHPVGFEASTQLRGVPLISDKRRFWTFFKICFLSECHLESRFPCNCRKAAAEWIPLH